MADRIYKGRIVITSDIDQENQLHFDEAASDFNRPHKGGLVPFEVLKASLMDVADKEGEVNRNVDVINGSLFIKSDAFETWIKIDPDGTIEIGAGAA